jgi:hypothetical protein
MVKAKPTPWRWIQYLARRRGRQSIAIVFDIEQKGATACIISCSGIGGGER